MKPQSEASGSPRRDLVMCFIQSRTDKVRLTKDIEYREMVTPRAELIVTVPIKSSPGPNSRSVLRIHATSRLFYGNQPNPHSHQEENLILSIRLSFIPPVRGPHNVAASGRGRKAAWSERSERNPERSVEPSTTGPG
jgi:hypothetical protein